MLVKDLKNLAKTHGIKSYSKMKKAELEKVLAHAGAIKGSYKIFMFNCNEQEEQTYNDHFKQEVIQEMFKIKNTYGNKFKVFRLLDTEDRLLAYCEN